MSHNMCISVRQAVFADIDKVAPLFDDYRQFYGQASNADAARDFLIARANHGESTLFLAEDEGCALGFAQLFPAFSSVSLARTFILNDLYVRPDVRRMGVGKSLVKCAEAFAHALGAARLTLSTAITNKQAQALYSELGWKQDEEFYVFHRMINT